MKKIGIFLESDPSGGGIFQHNQIILDAVAALPRDSFAAVVCYTSPLWRDYLREYDLKAVQVAPGFWGRGLGLAWNLLGLPMGLWRRISPLVFPLTRALQREQCDLWIFPSQDARGYQIPVPALIVVADLMHRYERSFPESASRWQYLVRERHYASICRFAKGILVDSEMGRRHVMESYGTPAGKIHVLPLMPPKYMRSVQLAEGFDERYRLPAKFLFYPAQFWEHKNHKRLVRALALLKPEHPDLKLVLAGSRKNAFDSVQELVEELGLKEDVLFLGYVPDGDMPELYRRARALVMPTFFGPTNIPPLEAFLAGCPVAISGTYGMPEQAGGAALHFHPESVPEMAECIRRLWSDDSLCRELAEKGRARAAEWGPREFNERLLEIVTAVTGEGGSR